MQRVEGEGGVLVVGRDGFLDLVLVAGVGARAVVGEGLRAGELVVGGGGGDDVALAGDLAGEALDGAGDLVDLAEDDDAGEGGARVVGDLGVEEEDAYGGGWSTYLGRGLARGDEMVGVRMSPPCVVGTSVWDSVTSMVMWQIGC